MEILKNQIILNYLLLWFLFSAVYVHSGALKTGSGGSLFYKTFLNVIIDIYANLSFIIQTILIFRIASNLNLGNIQGVIIFLLGWLVVYTLGGIIIRGILGRVIGVTLSFISLIIIPYLIFKIW